MTPDFRQPSHLPKVRGDAGDDPKGLPRQKHGTTPQMHGRYPSYDCLANAGHWDELTRGVIAKRVDEVPPLRFFDPPQAATLTAFCDVMLAQDAEPRIPVLAFIDQKLEQGRLDGYQYADMPDDRETWQLVAEGLDETARRHGAPSFGAAPVELQQQITDEFSDGRASGAAWEKLSVEHAWSVVTRSMLAAFYSHPWAWNEIGFGGPAYPRGYARLGVGLSEAWEGDEAFEVDPVSDVRERGLE